MSPRNQGSVLLIIQLSRLTGISYGVIQKLKNDQENRPR